MSDCPTIVVLGVQSRQEYIAQNNRLRQTIGASKLIDETTEEWRSQPRGGQVLYIGGGNAVLRFPSRSLAAQAIANWSADWLRRAPGIRLAAGWAPITESLGQAWHQARTVSLPHNEEWGALGLELGPLPFTRSCPDTGSAAVYEPGEPPAPPFLSAEALAKERSNKLLNQKLRQRQPDNEKLRLYVDQVLGSTWDFPTDLDELGLLPGKNQVAIIHCDGNGMGELFARLHCLPDSEFGRQLAARSNSCSAATLRAIVRTLQRLRDDLKAGFLRGEIDLYTNEHGRQLLPVRPLVDSGDDITWIAHGRLGLYLAAHFCKEFEWATEQLLGDRKTACAGVLFMPASRPFSRAYQLAAALCSAAKRHRRSEPDHLQHSWLDFHVDLHGAIDDLDWIRANQYQGLLARPYSLGSPIAPGTFLPEFDTKWRHFAETKPWAEARSRSKKLLESASAGIHSYQAQVDTFKRQSYPLPAGWNSSPREVFDALELLDFHSSWSFPVASYVAGATFHA
jgi:hypothetical protein